jgi:hypothetical protein
MDHSEAKNTGAVEKYLLGQLSEEESSLYEEHFFECLECAEEVKSGAAFIANAKEVLADAPVAEVAPLAAPAEKPAWMGFFWPVPMGAMAAVLLLAVVSGYQALLVVPRLETEIATAEAPQAAPWSFLSVSRSEPQVVRLPKGTRMAGLTLSRSSERSFPYYRCDVETDGQVVSSAVVQAPSPGDELEMLIPVLRLQPGLHAVVLHGLESVSGEVVAPEVGRYQFTLEYNEED